MSWATSSCYKKSLDRVDKDRVDKDTGSSSTDKLHPNPDARENSFTRWYGRGHGHLLMLSSAIETQVVSGVWFFRWHSRNSRHLPLRKAETWQPSNIFNIYRSDIGWNDYHFDVRWQFAYGDSSQLNFITQMGDTGFVMLVKISITKKEGWLGLDKSDGRP